jgi:phenylalanyl-tRNA synthetase beta chain
MKLPLRWLKEYVDFNVTIDEFVERLMWRGFEVSEVADEMPGIKNVVVCTINKIAPHPQAEKLRICTVGIGSDEPVQIVTNSKRVYEGAQVPVALCGATLHDGTEIKPTSLRGVESQGMFCGGHELGLTDADYEGAGLDEVLIFNEPHPDGQSVQEAFELDSVIFDIELTPNRADCQSIIGMCREAAAALGQKFIEPKIREVTGVGDISEYAKVTVGNSELCPRYCARAVIDLRIGPSPKWLQKKLRSVGLRPINNIVDITNLVMVEYGHPMHAFDLACVNGGHIIVRNAYEGETVITLDGKRRDVTPDMLLIADPQKGVGIAGVMGGENSEITANTRATLFESAVFKGSSIRSTTRKLHHTTDSAIRFMRGVEPVNAMKAVKRAIELVDSLNAGRVIGGTIDVCGADINERIVEADWRHINRINNLELEPRDMAELLETINIRADIDGEKLRIRVPHYRVDIESGIETDWDIAEEIARLYGYERINPTLMRGETFCGSISAVFKAEDRAKDLLAALGACEMYNYNFMSPDELSSLKLGSMDERRLAVKIMNPFGQDQSLMRTTLIPGMLRSLAVNLNRRTEHSRFFEIGNVHINNNPSLPEQRKNICIAYMDQEDFFTLKGTVESLLMGFGINDAAFRVGYSNHFQPGQNAVLIVDGEEIGEMGAIHPDTLKAFDITARVFICELSFDKLFGLNQPVRAYSPIPRYPVVKRDIAVIVDEGVCADDVARAILSAETGVIIEDIYLFDVYRGKGVPDGKKSMAYSFLLRSPDHTLVDEEITAAVASILESLNARLGAKLR